MSKSYKEFESYIIEQSMKSANAFWINPRGKIINLTGDYRHINYILDNSNEFRLSDADIEKIYDKYNEELGTEGKAREEIIINSLKRGWIQIRLFFNNRSQKWLLQVWKLDSRTLNNIQKFSEMFVKKRNKFDEFVVTELSSGSKRTYTIEELSQDILFKN